jgi:hypothetical protein
MNIRPSIWVLVLTMSAVMTLAVWHHFHHSPAGLTKVPGHPVAASVAAVPPLHSQLLPSLTPATVQTPAQTSASVQAIVNGPSFQQREQAIRLLTGRLADVDRQSLYDFLRQAGPEDREQSGQVLKNELLNALCELSPPPAGLRELLTQIYQDTSQDEVVRDYAVQHLAAFYRQMAGAAVMDAPSQADELLRTRQTLADALNNTDGSLAGTALLGLSQLSAAGYPGVDPDPIRAAALKLAGNGGAGELSRITAFQVCASLNVTNALPFIAGAARQGETVPVAISAIAALGALGGPDQIPFLNSLIQGGNDRLKLPAQHALSLINGRLKRPAGAS